MWVIHVCGSMITCIRSYYPPWEEPSLLLALKKQAALWEGPCGTELRVTFNQQSGKKTELLSPVTSKEINSSNKQELGSRLFPSQTWDGTAAKADTSVAALWGPKAENATKCASWQSWEDHCVLFQAGKFGVISLCRNRKLIMSV